MRTITIDELPQELHRHTVIKWGERTRFRRMGVALERTLSRCSEIRSEYESQTIKLRENSEKQGFRTGFQFFFTQLMDLISDYQRLQNARQDAFRHGFAQALRESLHDPAIVERIIHHLQEKCGHQKALRIIVPRGVTLPDDTDTSNYQYTDDNHITVQNDMDAVRFPSESLCCEWLTSAETHMIPLNEALNNLSPELLRDIAGTLIAFSNKLSSVSSLHTDQEECHDSSQ